MAPKAKQAVKKAAQAVKEALPSTNSKKAAPAPAPAAPPRPAAAPSSSTTKKATTASSQPKPTSIAIPPPATTKTSSGPKSAKVKTPADEGIDFFEGEVKKGDGDIRVFELKLAEDGGPTKEGAVSIILSSSFSSILFSRKVSPSSKGAFQRQKHFARGLTLLSYLFQYVRLPPPYPHPYILRLSLEPGTPASRNGVLKSDFPIDGGEFKRGKWAERK